MQRAGLSKKVSDRTVQRCLNKNGYYYLQARKKGLMTKNDQRKRRIFAKQVQGNYSADVWTSKVAFYLDGVSLFYKCNPADQVRAPKGRIWRKKCEGLSLGCTAKGSKELKIPPHSPDVNPIENLFHSMREKLRQQALKQNITHETFREFSDRVTTSLNNFSIAEIDKTIESMNNRLQLIKQSNGQRIKY